MAAFTQASTVEALEGYGPEALIEAGIEVDKKKVHLYTPIKELGKHSTTVKLHPDVSVELTFDVVSENPIFEAEIEDDSDED